MNLAVLKRYESYKDSGVEWLGEVPSYWLINRHKDSYELLSERCDKVNYLKVALENIEGKTGRFIPTDSEFDGNGVEFKKGDILFGKLRPYLAKVYLAEFGGNAVGDIFVYRPKRTVTSSFSQYLMLSDRYIDVINSSTAGAKMPRVSSNFIANLPVATPEIEEQKEITNYLDTKTAQIDHKIELLRQKSEKYSKLKQSLINETVTRGLDKSVPMKDSGIEWIGDVPVHWEVKRAKDFININPTTKIPISLSEGDLVEFIPMTNIDDVLGKVKNLTYVKLSEVSTGYTKFKNDDVIFAKITPCMENGNSAIVRGLTHNICFGSTEFMVFRVSNKLTEKYLHYFLHNELFRKNAEPFMKGTAGQKRISSHFMETHVFALPPLEEQKTIISYLDEKISKINRIIETVNSQINNLKELLKTLINDVVTGKVKVV